MPCVLVVEDEPALRRMLTFTLRDAGFDVRTAANGRAGLEDAQVQTPDVVVLDLEMPVMDGRTFFREFRRRGYTAPVVILSAYGARRAQRELQAEAAVQKPFRADDLIEKLEQLVDGVAKSEARRD